MSEKQHDGIEISQARGRFARLQRQKNLYDRNETPFPIERTVEMVFLDKQLGESWANWKRHYTDQEYETALEIQERLNQEKLNESK